MLRYWKDQTTPLQITATSFTNSGFRVTATGPSGHTNVLEYSTDLSGWSPVLTNVPGTNQFFLDDLSAGTSNRFYRLRSGP